MFSVSFFSRQQSVSKQRLFLTTNKFVQLFIGFTLTSVTIDIIAKQRTLVVVVVAVVVVAVVVAVVVVVVVVVVAVATARQVLLVQKYISGFYKSISKTIEALTGKVKQSGNFCS